MFVFFLAEQSVGMFMCTLYPTATSCSLRMLYRMFRKFTKTLASSVRVYEKLIKGLSTSL